MPRPTVRPPIATPPQPELGIAVDKVSIKEGESATITITCSASCGGITNVGNVFFFLASATVPGGAVQATTAAYGADFTLSGDGINVGSLIPAGGLGSGSYATIPMTAAGATVTLAALPDIVNDDGEVVSVVLLGGGTQYSVDLAHPSITLAIADTVSPGHLSAGMPSCRAPSGGNLACRCTATKILLCAAPISFNWAC
jgi:hypothetical protein